MVKYQCYNKALAANNSAALVLVRACSPVVDIINTDTYTHVSVYQRASNSRTKPAKVFSLDTCVYTQKEQE